jgi:hypothetical protein
MRYIIAMGFLLLTACGPPGEVGPEHGTSLANGGETFCYRGMLFFAPYSGGYLQPLDGHSKPMPCHRKTNKLPVSEWDQ